MTPKVSIIVPIYNVEKFLPCCIESLLKQTLKDIEIILVDDVSPDSCPRICDEYASKDPRIKVVHKEENQGLGMGRNTGLAMASGEYVTFCDSDDFVELRTYETVYNICIQKELDICCFQHRRVSLDGAPLNVENQVKEKYFIGSKNVYQFLLGIIGRNPEDKESITYSMSTCMALFRRERFIATGIKFKSERTYASEDLIFMLDFLPFINSVGIIPNIFYNYRINPNSISHSYSKEKLYRLFNSMEYLRSYCHSNFEWKICKNHYYTQILRLIKVILRYTSYSDLSFKKKIQMLNEVSRHPFLEELYLDPICKKYNITDRIILYFLKHHCGLFFIFLYQLKRN